MSESEQDTLGGLFYCFCGDLVAECGRQDCSEWDELPGDPAGRAMAGSWFRGPQDMPQDED